MGMFKTFVIFRHIYGKLGVFTRFNPIKYVSKYQRIKPQLFLMLSPAYAVKFEDRDDKVPVETQNLAPKELVRNAAICAVDSASSLLTQTTCRLLQLEGEYVEALQEVLILFEANTISLDNEYQQQQIWDALLTVRHRLNKIKQEKLEVEAIFISAVTMIESASEAAHGSGAEYAGIAGSERLFSARSRVNHAAQISSELEQKLNQQEVKNIEALSKHAEKVQRKRAEEEAGRQSETNESKTNKSESIESETNKSESYESETRQNTNIDLDLENILMDDKS